MTKTFPCPVTTIFARKVRPGEEQRYETWLAGIAEASSHFAGAQGTTILRPGEGRSEYVAVVQFDCAANLERWMISPERAHWLEALEDITLDAEEVSSLTGMERWFTLPDRSVSQAPPKWKSGLLVLLGLYPLVLLITPLMQRVAGEWPGPLRVLFSLTVSVSIMVFFVMPQLSRVFFRWLYPEPKRGELTRRAAR
jgi:antibiotic biosynthesis monooxygenase (ABM) superfamily enzyme